MVNLLLIGKFIFNNRLLIIKIYLFYYLLDLYYLILSWYKLKILIVFWIFNILFNYMCKCIGVNLLISYFVKIEKL